MHYAVEAKFFDYNILFKIIMKEHMWQSVGMWVHLESFYGILEAQRQITKIVNTFHLASCSGNTDQYRADRSPSDLTR